MATDVTSAAAVAAAFFVFPALAFFPPEDSRDGVSMRLVGFDEGRSSALLEAPQRDASAPFAFDVAIANATDEPVSGHLSVWLNDDWNVSVQKTAPLREGGGAERRGENAAAPAPGRADLREIPLSPHSTNTFSFTAIPRPGRVLPALYPIHATFALPSGEPLHPIAVFLAACRGAGFQPAGDGDPPDTNHPIRLASLPASVFTQMPSAASRSLAESTETGAYFDPAWVVASGDVRHGFSAQPPWRTGAGFVWRDIPVRLPDSAPLQLLFSMAIAAPIKDGEGRGDGADFKVFVVEDGGLATEVHSSLVTSRSWIDATADLSPWAGKDVTIRLWNGTGPKNDPNYDRCLWGGVGVVAGDSSLVTHHSSLRQQSWRIPLSVRGESWTATVAPGPCGLLDGRISFTDGERTLSFTGFTCAIDDIAVGSGPLDARCTGVEVEVRPDAQTPLCAILHRIDLRDGRTVAARARVWADGPALRVAWDMPGAERDHRGSPRFTRLGIGPGSLPAARAYVSFGNVLETPRAFALAAGNFRNLARHAGADYANGASLCQAVDVFPDRVVCRREANAFAVETCHDATFAFVPSSRGAFAAARAFRDVCGYLRSPSWREAATRMCLDQWGGGFATAIAGLEKAAKYGVTNAVFVRHGWQRWGFDYRLPEIWPAGGRVDGFLAMAATAKRLGMVFAAHDNYIDCYPDSVGFSYDNIVFNPDGTPRKAWFNGRKKAQSYRWAPGAFMPWLRSNAAALRDAVAPDACFIDVFANLAPWDWFGRDGRFHPRTETAAAWGEAFDEYRRILGSPAGVMISETGHDALVGHLDAGQADHLTPAAWMSSEEYDDAERVPWQDIVTHGSFVLYGGGLGWRYSSNSHSRKGSDPATGSGSDSYLCTTVMGGRSPMCDFEPFDIRAVSTCWLVGDICRNLALSEFESCEFEGSIHRQRATFAGDEGGGKVWVNRPAGGREAKPPSRAESWNLPNGVTLPPDGFYAETRSARAGIVEIGGRRCAFSQSPASVFVDARKSENVHGAVDFASCGLGVKTDGAFRLERDKADGGLILTPLPESGPFRAEIDLASIALLSAPPSPGGAVAAAVVAVEPVEPALDAAWPAWSQSGGVLSLSVDAMAFAYRIRLGRVAAPSPWKRIFSN